MIVRVDHGVRMYSMLDTVVTSGEYMFVLVWCLTLWMACLCLVVCGPTC